MSREWREDDPLNGPRCLTSALVCFILILIIVGVVWKVI